MRSEQGWTQQTSESSLCASGCGFFGNASTMGLCSKCCRDLRIEEEQVVTDKYAAVKNTLKNNAEILPVPVEIVPPTIKEAIVTVGGADQPEPSRPGRCGSCNKKVGLTGFKCKCGITYCSTHRYPEKHECKYDFKTSGRDQIVKANPVIVADKLDG